MFLISSVSSRGPARLGGVSSLPLGALSYGWFQPRWPEGSAPAWCGASCLPGLGWSLWRRSLQPWTRISLSVAGPPEVASSAPQVSLPGHVSLVTASVCVGVSVYMRVYVFVYVSVHTCGGWEGWALLIFFSWLLFTLLFYNPCCCF